MAPQLPKSIIDVVRPDSGVWPSQFIPLTLRWESALPIRVAELKPHIVEPPTLANGVPGGRKRS
jgi:hypothetical protein